MKNKIVNILYKLFIVCLMIYLFMSINSDDIEYIYANF